MELELTARRSCTTSSPWECAAKRACICAVHTCEEELGGLLLVIGGGIPLAEIGACQEDNVWRVSGVKKRCFQGAGSMERVSARRARMSADRRGTRVEDDPARKNSHVPAVSSQAVLAVQGKKGPWTPASRELLRLRERWRK